MRALESFPLSGSFKRALGQKLAAKGEIFAINEDPLLGSLIAALGLQFELGQPKFDRLSPLLGAASKQWISEVVTLDGMIGMRAYVPGMEELKPIHPGFTEILHPLSLDQDGKLSQIVIFPALVAERYKRKALELVIVRDWVTSTFLPVDGKPAVMYLETNAWEIQQNTARLQAQLMVSKQVSFSGTHDLADHLLNGMGIGFDQNLELYTLVRNTYRSFTDPAGSQGLLVSYLIGVLLDDLAQPRWYDSRDHVTAISRLIVLLKDVWSSGKSQGAPVLDHSFHRFVHALRSGVTGQAETYLAGFAHAVRCG